MNKLDRLKIAMILLICIMISCQTVPIIINEKKPVEISVNDDSLTVQKKMLQQILNDREFKSDLVYQLKMADGKNIKVIIIDQTDD